MTEAIKMVANLHTQYLMILTSHKLSGEKKNAMRAIFASEVQNIFCIKSLIDNQRIHSQTV